MRSSVGRDMVDHRAGSNRQFVYLSIPAIGLSGCADSDGMVRQHPLLCQGGDAG